jgi:hypothetical protein
MKPYSRADHLNGGGSLSADIIAPAREHGRYGYRKITALLRAAGWLVNPALLHNSRGGGCCRGSELLSGRP